MILAGDIGGTKTNLAVFEDAAGRKTLAADRFPSREHASLDEIVRQFVSDHRLKVERACFGVAGPVRNNRVETTNLPWVIDGDTLAAELGVPTDRLHLINDLEANAWGIASLAPED